MSINNLIKVILLFLYPAILFASTHFGNRNDINVILIVAIILPLYFYFLSDIVFPFGNRFNTFFLYAILLRLVVVGSPAIWSDDIYRYLFDAKVFLEGISPYKYTPEELLGLNQNNNLLLESLVTKMNSPNYYSVYPLLLQLFFSLGTILGFVLGNSFIGVQVLLLGFDILNLFLIRKLYPGRPNKSYWLYFGNPVVIFEGISQMHPEILLVTGFLFIFVMRSIGFRMVSFFLLTQLKINTFIFILGFRWKREILIRLFAITALSLVLWKVSVFSDLVSQGSAGIGLFFHSFRFAGIIEPFFYFVLVPLQVEYLSGVLSFAVLSILYIFCLKKNILTVVPLPDRFFILYSLFLLFSPVIHPWYWIPWVLFVLGKEKMETLVVAISFLAFLSYGLYVTNDFIYIHWVTSILVLGFYGKKQINYLRKTT